MDNSDYASLIYLVLLGGAVLMWFFAQNRASMGKLTQQALVWGLIFVGVIAAVGLWGDIRQTVRPSQTVLAQDQRIELPRSPDAGIDTDGLAYVGRANTANGTVRTAPVRLDRLSIGPIEDHDLRAVVNEGSMSESLLGMDYLQRYSSVEIGGGKLVLSR